jgi:hypothetical protein
MPDQQSQSQETLNRETLNLERQDQETP